MLLVCPKRISVGVKGGRRHCICNVKAFVRWRLVNNNSSATIHHVALHSLNHSRQVAALTKDQHLKVVRWHRAPLPPPYALYEYINVDNCERPLTIHKQSLGLVFVNLKKAMFIFEWACNSTIQFRHKHCFQKTFSAT